MNGRLFPAVRVNFRLATVVRHRDRIEPPTPTLSSPSVGGNTDPKMCIKNCPAFHTHISPPLLFLQQISRRRLRTRSDKGERAPARTRLVFSVPDVSAPQAQVHMHKLCQPTKKKSIRAVELNATLTCPRALSWTHMAPDQRRKWGASLSLVLLISHFLRLTFSICSPYRCHPLQGRAWLHG